MNRNLTERFKTSRRLSAIIVENLLDINFKKLDIAEGLLGAGKELNDDEAKLVKAYIRLEECINDAYDMSEIMKEHGMGR